MPHFVIAQFKDCGLIGRYRDVVWNLLGDNAEYENYEDYHITLTYAVAGGDEQIARDAMVLLDNSFAVVIDGMGIFETPDGYAIHLKVRKTAELIQLQRQLYQNFVNAGFQMSSYSNPDSWQPHITLAYSKTPIQSFSVDPFPMLVGKLELSAENKREVVVNLMKSTGGRIIDTSIRETVDGDIIIPVIGIPFGTVDMDGDFFDKSTYTGPLNEVLAYFDHGLDELYLKSELKELGYSEDKISELIKSGIGFGRQLIGVAQRGDTTEEGIIWNVIVNRRHKYKKVLKRAAEEGLIGSSSGAKTRINDPNIKGRVAEWHTVEVSFSASEKNPSAEVLRGRPLVAELAKSFFTESEMSDKQEVTPSPTPVPEEGQGDKKATPLTDKLNDLFNQNNKSDTGDGENTLFALLKSMSAQLDALTNLVKSIPEINTRLAMVEDQITDTQSAMELMGEQIAKSLTGTIKDEVNKSSDIRQAERVVESRVKNGRIPSGLPANAPGFKS